MSRFSEELTSVQMWVWYKSFDWQGHFRPRTSLRRGPVAGGSKAQSCNWESNVSVKYSKGRRLKDRSYGQSTKVWTDLDKKCSFSLGNWAVSAVSSRQIKWLGFHCKKTIMPPIQEIQRLLQETRDMKMTIWTRRLITV